MKTSTGIRFAIAAIIGTLGCLGLLAHVTNAGICFALAFPFVVGRAELTRPIPRSERRLTIIGVSIFLAVVLTVPFLHMRSRSDAAQRIMGHPALVVPLWLMWLWFIYRAWQREKITQP
jgi:hypothetical protein